jgi:glycosyltransferase involved in cell wall biosynthesis
MKIGIVCYPTFGGSGVLATELGKALADKGHEIHFITYQQPVRLNGFHENIFYHEVRVPTYPLFDFPPYELALASTMVDVILNHDLDLIHAHYAIPHASAAYTAKQIVKQKTGRLVPVITTLHGTDITLVGRDKTYEPVVTFSINESDAITAVSENLKQETLKHFEIRKEIEVIHNFVDLKRFNKKPLTAFKKVISAHDEKIVVHASNFRKLKRIDDVMEIFKNIHAATPSKLLMVGDGPFLGKQEQMEDILAVSDLFLLPSEYESFGLVALEAMASSVAVISSNAGGLGEINIDGKTGYTANVGDVATMSARAIELLKDDSKLKAFKHNALEQAKLFDIHHIIPIYENLYRRFCRTGDC